MATNKRNLESEKEKVQLRISKLQEEIEKAKKELEQLDIDIQSSSDGVIPSETITSKNKQVEEDDYSKDKSKDLEKAEKRAKQREAEKQKLESLKASIANRSKGKYSAPEGNHVKYSKADVYLYLVDDNELQLKVLQEKFKNTKSFQKTLGFTKGEKCLEYIKNHKYPSKSIIIVIIDFYLEDAEKPELEAMNGIDLLGDLKKYDSEIEVIIMSGHDDPDLEKAANRYGAVSFIKKSNDAFKKMLNNIAWTIRDKEIIRKKLEAKQNVKVIAIGLVSVIVILLLIDIFSGGALGILPKKQKVEQAPVENYNPLTDTTITPAK